MAKQKVYAVKVGRQTGIFNNWEECQASIKGYSGSIFKSFDNETDAINYLNDNQIVNRSDSVISNNEIEQLVQNDLNSGITIIFVDGSYDDQIKKYSYGAYILELIDNKVETHELSNAHNHEKYLPSRNVSGEIFGVIKSMEWCISQNKKNVKFYYDYEGIEKWAQKTWEAKSDIAQLYQELFDKNKLFFDSINFHKVPAHSGIEWNNKADALAKSALKGKPKKYKSGLNWCTIKNFHDFDILISKLKTLQNLNWEESENDQHCYTIKLSFSNEKLTIKYFNTKSLTIQGKMSSLFVNVLYILSEILKSNQFESIINDVIYKKQIDNYLPNELFINYPENLLVLIRTSLKLLSNISNDNEDYSYLVFTPLKTLEGHIKHLLKQNNIPLSANYKINCFIKTNDSNKYKLPKKFASLGFRKENLEKCYNFYHKYRHLSFHYVDVPSNKNYNNIMSDKEYAISIAYECIDIIKKTI